MRTSFLLAGAVGALLLACGGSAPPPSDRLASAEAASRSARELGAEKEPKAAYHLQLADEQVAQAKKLMADGDNKRADMILQRAGADAELAVMMAKEATARVEAEKSQARLKNVKEGK